MYNWKTTHSNAKIPASISESELLEDVSYGNDIMPSFVFKPSHVDGEYKNYLMVWVDYEKQDSELFNEHNDGTWEWHRFGITAVIDEDMMEGPNLWVGDDVKDMMQALAILKEFREWSDGKYPNEMDGLSISGFMLHCSMQLTPYNFDWLNKLAN